MSDTALLNTLIEKGLFSIPEKVNVSWSMALLSQEGTGLLLDQVVVPGDLRIGLLPLESLYLEQKPAAPAAMEGLVKSIEFILALQDHMGEHSLRDQDAVSILETLSFKPEPPQEGLAGTIQAGLRLELSLRDFSRADVRQALRQVLRAAQKGLKNGDGRSFLGHIHHLIH
jgi:hypothetical protein